VRRPRPSTPGGSAGDGQRGEEAPLLIVAATEMELGGLLPHLADRRDAGLAGWPAAWSGRLAGRRAALVAGGIGKASAAGAVAAFAERLRPSACLMTGIAGAYVGAFVPVGAAACAASETDLDAGVAYADRTASLAEIPLARVEAGPHGPARYETFPTDPAWREALASACGLAPQRFATSDAVSGDLDVAAARAHRSGAALESMEGAGAALACARLGLPFAELRGVSNVAGVRDKVAWDVPAAIAAASGALLRALAHGPV
jgi:futalosine hydrolase